MRDSSTVKDKRGQVWLQGWNTLCHEKRRQQQPYEHSLGCAAEHPIHAAAGGLAAAFSFLHLRSESRRIKSEAKGSK